MNADLLLFLKHVGIGMLGGLLVSIVWHVAKMWRARQRKRKASLPHVVVTILEFHLFQYTYCVPSVWPVDHAVRQFDLFLDGVLLQLEKEDTEEGYTRMAHIRDQRTHMTQQLRAHLPLLQQQHDHTNP